MSELHISILSYQWPFSENFSRWKVWSVPILLVIMVPVTTSRFVFLVRNISVIRPLPATGEDASGRERGLKLMKKEITQAAKYSYLWFNLHTKWTPTITRLLWHYKNILMLDKTWIACDSNYWILPQIKYGMKKLVDAVTFHSVNWFEC